MSIEGEEEVIHERFYTWLHEEGIWEEKEWLDPEEQGAIEEQVFRWFGKRVRWGSIESNRMMQAFHRLSIGIRS